MESYLTLIKTLIAFFEDMVLLESDKVKAASDNNIIKVEECMKKEQADILKLRGLEQKRLKLQQELGFDNMTFQEVVAHAPNEYQPELNSLLKQMKDVIIRFQAANDSAGKVIEVNLHKIDKIITQLKEQQQIEPDGKSYNSSGTAEKTQRHFSARKV